MSSKGAVDGRQPAGAGADAAELRGLLELLELVGRGAADEHHLPIRFARACVLHVIGKLEGDAGREAAALDTLEALAARLRSDAAFGAIAQRWTGDGAERDVDGVHQLLDRVFLAIRGGGAR